jgi:hypothetical protein
MNDEAKNEGCPTCGKRYREGWDNAHADAHLEVEWMRGVLRGLVSAVANDETSSDAILKSFAYAQAQRLCAFDQPMHSLRRSRKTSDK